MRVKFTTSFRFFKHLFQPVHGPQTWPWWRLFSLALCRLDAVVLPSTGYRLWVYTRSGAFYLEVFLDRRRRPLW